MIKKNSKKRNIIIRLVILASSFVFIAGIITSLTFNKNISNPGLTKYNGYYNGTNIQIKEPSSMTAADTITMTEANSLSSVSKTITIESSDELYLFSQKVKTNTSFLGYDYKLINNILWDDGYYFAPIGTSDNKFSGTFDGQGYEIEGLTMSLASSTTETEGEEGSSYTEKYFSMFNYNSGTISNLGLTHPKITVNRSLAADGGISYLVGENSGTIGNSFVVDDGDATIEQAGIYAAGDNARVSSFVVNNIVNGTLKNNYVVVGSVVNIKNVAVAEYNEIAISNSGTIDDCYFYNESIKSYELNGNTAKVTYKTVYGLSDKSNQGVFGENVSKIDDLITELESVDESTVDGLQNGWYTKFDYGDLGDYTGIKYALRRGIACNDSKLTINNEKDFAYMFELFNADDKLASKDVTYEITNNLNLDLIPVNTYIYNKGISAHITGINIANGKPTLVNNSISEYPTIYNFDVLNEDRKTVSTGVDCYGLFNYLTGTVENLNIVPNDINLNNVSTTTNTVGIGALSGYIEGGIVNNVNVYVNIINNESNNVDIKEYYLGGITGILGGNGKISNSTTAGEITLNSATNTIPNKSTFMRGVAIGGIVGFIESSLGAVYDSLNAIDINVTLGSNITYAIGGVIGAGYTTNYEVIKTDGIVTKIKNTGKLENAGNIEVSGTYSELYVAGIIARLNGETDQVSEMTNNGDITVTANGTGDTYVSGVLNADIIRTKIVDTGLEASAFKDAAGNTLFYAASLSNGGDVKVLNSSTNVQYTNVLNVKSSNDFITKLNGLYNLSYQYLYPKDDNTAGEKSKVKNTNDAQNIDMSLFKSFAPVLNVIGGTSQYTTYVESAYNLRDINYNLSSAISSETTFNYTGVALGGYITYKDIRNEGNLTVTLNSGISTTSDTSKLNISGLFEKIDSGCTAENLYNGGDIKVYEPEGSTSNKKIDMYISGICKENLAVDSSIEQNPLNADFNKELKGTLANAINNGNITVGSFYLDKEAKINASSEPTNKPHFSSNIYAGGITYDNSGIISSAFNLGTIDIALYSINSDMTYLAGGISCIMTGEYAQIRDSANNGDIYVIDVVRLVHDQVNHTITPTQTNIVVVVGGIVATNDANNTNSKQVISFTINYGTIVGFQSNNNMKTISANDAHSMAGGILGKGLCNLVDIVNYGSIYSNECSGGIVSIVNCDSFDSTKTLFANTINYGLVRITPQYYDIQGQGNENFQFYNNVRNLTSVEGADTYIKKTSAGSICAVFDFANKNIVEVRYLISLFKGANTVLYSLNCNGISPDVSTFITAKSAVEKFGDKNGTTYIKYADLTTTEDADGNVGVFNPNFVFRKAIDGVGLDSNFITDSYISNFFQFVKFDKINTALLDKIDWRTIAYKNAAEELVKNVSALKELVDKSNDSANSKLLLEDAFNGNTWLENCDLTILDSLIETALESNDFDGSLSELFDYVFLNSSSLSTYSQNIMIRIIDKIVEYYEIQGGADYYTVLQTLLYDEIVAKIISGDSSNYLQVKDLISEYLEDSNNLDKIVDTYIEVLNNNSSLLNPLFNNSTYPTTVKLYENAKIDLINTLLDGYDEGSLADIYKSLNGGSENSVVKYKMYLENNPGETVNVYKHLIANNGTNENDAYLENINYYLKKYDIASAVSECKTNNTLDDNTINDFPLIAETTGYKYTPITSYADYNSENSLRKFANQNFVARDLTSLNITPVYNYTDLWNVIKNDSSIQSYINTNICNTTVTNPNSQQEETGLIAKATEYNNTYQTNDRAMSDYYYYLDGNYHAYGLDISNYNGISYGLSAGASSFGQIYFYNYNQGTDYGKTIPMRTRFLYTPDQVVSYRTNYLGPYSDTSGHVYDQPYKVGTDGQLKTAGYMLDSVLYASDTGASSNLRSTVPLMLVSNETLANTLISQIRPNNDNSKLYLFFWIDSRMTKDTTYKWDTANGSTDFQWKQYDFATLNKTSRDNATGYLYKDYNSGEYVYDYYNFDPEYVATKQNEYNRSTGTYDHMFNTDASAENYIHTNIDDYFTAYCSAAAITGLWYTYSIWSAQHLTSLHAKDETAYAFGYGCGVHTTDYICYKLDDLIALDGKKTKGKNSTSPTFDEDEVNIISAIVTKMISERKDLVLNAIANYAIDNQFDNSVGHAQVLRFLLSSISESTFAKNCVIENLSSFMTLNYDSSNTLTAYLASKNIRLDNYKDRIIAIAANNQTKFKNLLILLLEEYSKKTADYSTYNTYQRDEATFFIYEYIRYKYGLDENINWNDFGDLINDISDNDLSYLFNIFHVMLDQLDIDQTNIYDGDMEYTVNDAKLIDSSYIDYSTYYDSSYNRVLVGKTNYNSGTGTGSNITFTAGNWVNGYDLVVVYKGDIYLDDNSNHRNSNSVSTVTYSSVSSNAEHTLYFDQGTQVYSVQLLSHEGYDNARSGCDTAVSPFANNIVLKQVKNVNFVLNNGNGVNLNGNKISNNTLKGYYGNYYSFLYKRNSVNKNVETNNESEASLRFTLDKGSNINITEVSLSYKTSSVVNPNDSGTLKDGSIKPYSLTNNRIQYVIDGSTKSFNSTGVTSTTQARNGITYYENVYQHTFNSTFINKLNTEGIGIILNMKKNGIANGDSTYTKDNLFFAVYDLKLTYTFTFVNGPTSSNKTTCIYNQDLFNGYYSNDYRSDFTLTNTDTHCGVNVTGGRTVTYDFTNASTSGTVPSGTTTYSTNSEKMQEALRFTPWYYPYRSQGYKFNSTTNLDTVDMDDNSIEDNLNAGNYNNLSDIAKYLIHDIFVKQDYDDDSRTGSFITSGESYVEFYATGEGYIDLYDYDTNEYIEDIYVSTTNDTYVWTEYITSTSCYFTVPDEVTLQAVYVTPIGGKISNSASGNINNVVYSLDSIDTTLVNFDYDSLKTIVFPDNISAFNTDFGTEYDSIYQIFYTVFPYYRSKNGYSISDLRNEDLLKTVMTLWGTMKWDSDNTSYFTLFNDGTNLENVISSIQVGNQTYLTKSEYILAEVDSQSFVTDGTLFTRSLGNEYVSVTSGSFDSTKVYYKYGYYEVTLGENEFTTDGTLFTLEDDVYTTVTSGSFDSTKVYYKYGYYLANISKSNFTIDGSLYIRPYVYTAVTSGSFDFDEHYYVYGSAPLFDNDALLTIIRLIAVADVESYRLLVNGIESEYYKEILKSLDAAEIRLAIAKALYSVAYNHISYTVASVNSSTFTTDGSLYTKSGSDYIKVTSGTYSSQTTYYKRSYGADSSYLFGAYLGNDYLSKTNLYTTTIMYDLLNAFNPSDDTPDLEIGYQFITSNTTVDSERVTALINYLSNNSNIDIDGYGIFALSSSHGIGYGVFVPDNMDLSKLDAPYDSSLEMTAGDSASWRGGSDISQGAIGTVDHAFYHDMKQLIKSISTDIFELNLTVGSTIIKSVDDQIDNDNHVITYYVISGLSDIYNATSIVINPDYQLANGATISSLSIDLNNRSIDYQTNPLNPVITISDAFIVSAEDTTVSNKVTLKFVSISPSNNLKLDIINYDIDNDESLSYDGGLVEMNLTGNTNEIVTGLLDGMDVEPYVSVSVGGVTYSSEDGYWKFDKSYKDNCIVKNGSATIKIIVDKSLPGGDNAVEFKVSLGNNPTATITKDQAEEALITEFGFVGFAAINEYTSDVPTSISSIIPYGRAYNYDDLTNPLSDNFYLYKFKVSDNAKVDISATKKIIVNGSGNNAYSNGLMKYTITFVITSEDGNTTKTYTHILNEKPYFEDNSEYATIYADGDIVTKLKKSENEDYATPEEYEAAHKALDEDEKPKYLYQGTLTYTLGNDICICSTYDENKEYYVVSYVDGNPEYVTANVDAKSFRTDGYLYLLKDSIYTPVYNGTFSNALTYYTLKYVQVEDMSESKFTTNGSLYTLENRGTTENPIYSYEQVIDRMSNEDDIKASVAFNRGYEPQYRIKYSLSNFYTLGNNVAFSATNSTLGNLATTNVTYAGLTVTVSDNNETGTYTFVYTYKNTGIWEDGEEYIRYYEFPEFIVEKHASTDSLLHKLTFLEESIVLGNTATVILPTTPIMPDRTEGTTTLYEETNPQYYSEQFKSDTRNIVVSTNGVSYKNNTDNKSITDYYAIGTVSEADLSYYCPTFEVNQYAQIYQYTTLKKLLSYGIGVQKEMDSTILSNHDNIYLYVPFIDSSITVGDNTVILLVELDEVGNWTNVYPTDYAGSRYKAVTNGLFDPNAKYYTVQYNLANINSNSFVTDGSLFIRTGEGTNESPYSYERVVNGEYDSNLTYCTANYTYDETITASTFTLDGSLYVDLKLHTYAGNVTTKNAKIQGEFGTYSVSSVAGEEKDNSSLYMDYVGTPLDGHFWYVSYVVFSEDWLGGATKAAGNVRYYHISIIDATNNVQFEVKIYADTDLNADDIFLTISENTFEKIGSEKNITGKRQISAYADPLMENDQRVVYSGSREDIAGYDIYELKYKLQSLPAGFFYFYVDLPVGFTAEAYTDKVNTLVVNNDTAEKDQDGSYLPYTSIITVKIKLEIVISKGTVEDSGAWAVNTANEYTRQAEYEGIIPA